MPKRTSSYNSWHLEKLANPKTAAAYLSAAISDSPEMFRKALRNVAQARQMAKVARVAGVTRESLYRATSEIGNPTLDTLESVLTALGIKIRFETSEIAGTTVPVGRTISHRTVATSSTVYQSEIELANAQAPNYLSYQIRVRETISNPYLNLAGTFYPQSGVGEEISKYVSQLNEEPTLGIPEPFMLSQAQLDPEGRYAIRQTRI